MGARWVWALVAAVAAGATAVAVVAVVDDGPQAADAQATTTTTAPSGGGGGSGTSAPLRTVTVTAEGTASGTPDTAVVQLGVQTQAASAKDALEQANQKAAQLLDALKFGGVKPDDITTTNVFVYPQYGANGQTITGYQAGNSVSATIRDVTKAGTIIDAAAGVVGDQITLQGVSFNIDDTGSLRQAAARRRRRPRQVPGRPAGRGDRAEGRQGGVDRRGHGPEHPPRVRRGGCSGHHGGRLDAGPAPAGAAGAEPVRHGRLRAHVVSGRTDRTASLS